MSKNTNNMKSNNHENNRRLISKVLSPCEKSHQEEQLLTLEKITNMEKSPVKDVSDKDNDATLQKGYMEKSPVNNSDVQDNSLEGKDVFVLKYHEKGN